MYQQMMFSLKVATPNFLCLDVLISDITTTTRNTVSKCFINDLHIANELQCSANFGVGSPDFSDDESPGNSVNSFGYVTNFSKPTTNNKVISNK